MPNTAAASSATTTNTMTAKGGRLEAARGDAWMCGAAYGAAPWEAPVCRRREDAVRAAPRSARVDGSEKRPCAVRGAGLADPCGQLARGRPCGSVRRRESGDGPDTGRRPAGEGRLRPSRTDGICRGDRDVPAAGRDVGGLSPPEAPLRGTMALEPLSSKRLLQLTRRTDRVVRSHAEGEHEPGVDEPNAPGDRRAVETGQP